MTGDVARDGDASGGRAPAEGYDAAVAELTAILDELEGDGVGVDALAARVARARDLVAFCRERLATARVQVTDVVVALDRPGASASGGEAEGVETRASGDGDATDAADDGGARPHGDHG